MNDLATLARRIPTMTPEAINKVRDLESVMLTLPQAEIATDHVLHGGMYARTIRIPAGVAITGAFIRVPTLLVVNGNVTVFTGGEPVTLVGNHVLAASAHRRQAFQAHKDTALTMVFATQAKTVEEAEDEFTNEAHLLMSRHPGAANSITITGE